MDKDIPDIVYRLFQYTGFESNKEYITFDEKSGKIKLKASNKFDFKDDDCPYNKVDATLNQTLKFYAKRNGASLKKAKELSIETKKEIHQKHNNVVFSNAINSSFFGLGIICTTTNIKSTDIWEKFTNWKGFAIGISTTSNSFDNFLKKYKFKAKQVEYNNTKINISPTGKKLYKDDVYNIIYRKPLCYKKEQEVRFVNFYQKEADRFLEKASEDRDNPLQIGTLKSDNILRTIELPPKCISEVILGCKMDADVRSKTIAFCQQYLPNIPIRTAILENGKVAIKC